MYQKSGKKQNAPACSTECANVLLSIITVQLQHQLKTNVGISTRPNADLLYRDEFQDETVALLATTGLQAKGIYWLNGPALGVYTNLYQ